MENDRIERVRRQRMCVYDFNATLIQKRQLFPHIVVSFTNYDLPALLDRWKGYISRKRKFDYFARQEYLAGLVVKVSYFIL